MVPNAFKYVGDEQVLELQKSPCYISYKHHIIMKEGVQMTFSEQHRSGMSSGSIEKNNDCGEQ